LRRRLLLVVLLLSLPARSWAAVEELSIAPPTHPSAPLHAELTTHFGVVLADASHVAQWRDVYLHQRRDWLEGSLRRAARLLPRFQAILEKVGVPQVLSYLPLIESGFQGRATSTMGAGGYWQFIPSTAHNFGLTLNPWVDERRDPEIATRAAGRYLKRLHNTFHDWPLALMAYNSGEGRIAGILSSLPSRTYREVVRSAQTPPETIDYVANFVAAAQIAIDPEGYGVTPPASPTPLPETTVVTVRGSVDLSSVASTMAMEEAELRRLNPALLQDCTPPGVKQGYPLRVPATAAESLRASLAHNPKTLSTRWTTHRVEPGEPLSAIADRYHVPMDDIARFNNLRGPRRLQAGTDLLIPVPEGHALAKNTQPERQDPPPRLQDSRQATHTVRAGDSLQAIAQRYRLTVGALVAWNGLAANATLHPGQILQLKQRPFHFHNVRQGESLWQIAKRYNTTVQDLRRHNGLGRGGLIHPGDQLKIPTSSGA
ncbi:MAG TPA: hypothetical protein DC005_00165, partial [Proteobacteria bacterium]|nr:hypothetical protein [Pseudomonadota bacterium]